MLARSFIWPVLPVCELASRPARHACRARTWLRVTPYSSTHVVVCEGYLAVFPRRTERVTRPRAHIVDAVARDAREYAVGEDRGAPARPELTSDRMGPAPKRRELGHQNRCFRPLAVMRSRARV